MHTLDELLSHFLRDMFYAEQQTSRLLPEVVSALRSQEARETVEAQLRVTRARVDALKEVFTAFGQAVQGATCEAILGLHKETEELLAETSAAGPIRDAGLVACLLAIQHYSVARYAALLTWAKLAGNDKAVGILSDMMNEARAGAERLDALAGGVVTDAAKSAA